jgi:hypothetical protein
MVTEAKKRANAKWRAKNYEHRAAYIRACAADVRQSLNIIKEESPCRGCGEFYPAVCMEFYHRDPREKRDHVSTLVGKGRRWETIVEEIRKCDILCANCHRLEHLEAW